MTIVDLLLATKVCSSRTAAKRLVVQGAVYFVWTKNKITDPMYEITYKDFVWYGQSN